MQRRPIIFIKTKTNTKRLSEFWFVLGMSDLLSTFTQYLNVNVWSNAVQQRLALCLDGSNIFSNRSDINESFSNLFKLKYSIQLTRMTETTKDKHRGQTETYICFTVNDDQCIITYSDSEFYIKVECK